MLIVSCKEPTTESQGTKSQVMKQKYEGPLPLTYSDSKNCFNDGIHCCLDARPPVTPNEPSRLLDKEIFEYIRAYLRYFKRIFKEYIQYV
jgi:hypothetical protein